MGNESNTISATETANFQLIAIKINKDKDYRTTKVNRKQAIFFL